MKQDFELLPLLSYFAYNEQIPIKIIYYMKEFNGIKLSELSKISKQEQKVEFKKLIETINLNKDETYDCSHLNIWSYRKAGDIREGINLRFGNMVKGFPLEVGGVIFNHSEGAYIAGFYASNDIDSIRIQGLLSTDRNGLWCKKTYRNLQKYIQFRRKDFYDYNIQWMMYVLWIKSIQNENFANLLRSLPIDAHIVENTSHHKGETATFWGAKNIPLRLARKDKEKEVAKNGVFRTKVAQKEAQMLAANAINDIGVFEGKNVMGKIIKIMSISLLFGQAPPIDYNLLKEKKLFMIGKSIEFQK